VSLSNELEGSLNVYVEQEDRKLKANIKKVKIDEFNSYEISFIPETDTKCSVECEFIDLNDNVMCGHLFKIPVYISDFIILPFPLSPFPINTKCSFKSIIIHFLFSF
jgi:hypothetical protein